MSKPTPSKSRPTTKSSFPEPQSPQAFAPRDLLVNSPLYEVLQKHEAFSRNENYLVKLWDKEKTIRETLEVISNFAANLNMNFKLEEFYIDYMMDQNKNKSVETMTESMSMLFSLEYHSLFDKEVKFLKEMMSIYGVVRFHLTYIRMRKGITGLFNKPNTHHTSFKSITLDVNRWSTLLNRIFDQGNHAERIIERIKDKIHMYYEKFCEKRKALMDSNLRIPASKFMEICIREYHYTTESLQHQNHFKFAVIKRSYTPPPRVNNDSMQRGLQKRKKPMVVAEFSPIGMREGELIDEASVKRLAILQKRRMELRRQLANSLQWVSLHRTNFLYISEFIIERFHAKYKFISDSAQRVQKLVQPLTNRIERDGKMAHLVTPVMQRAVNLVKNKENFPGSLLEAAKKKVGPYNIKMRREKAVKELTVIKDELDEVYLNKLTQNEESFALEAQFIRLGIPFNPESLMTLKNKLDSQLAPENGPDSFGKDPDDSDDEGLPGGLISSLVKAISDEGGGNKTHIKKNLKKAASKTFLPAAPGDSEEGAVMDQRSILSKMIQKSLGDGPKKIQGSDFGKKKAAAKHRSESQSARSEESIDYGLSRDMDGLGFRSEKKENEDKKSLEDLGSGEKSKVSLFSYMKGGSKNEGSENQEGQPGEGKRKGNMNLGQMLAQKMRKERENEEIKIEENKLIAKEEENAGKDMEKRNDEAKEESENKQEGENNEKKELPEEALHQAVEKNDEKKVEPLPEEKEKEKEKRDSVTVDMQPNEGEETLDQTRITEKKEEGGQPVKEATNSATPQKRRRSSMANFQKALTSIKAKQATNGAIDEEKKSQASVLDSDVVSISSKTQEQVQEGINKSQSTESINTLGRKHGSKKNLKAALSSIKSKASFASSGSHSKLEDDPRMGSKTDQDQPQKEGSGSKPPLDANKSQNASDSQPQRRRSSLANFKQALSSLQSKTSLTASKEKLPDIVEETN